MEIEIDLKAERKQTMLALGAGMLLALLVTLALLGRAVTPAGNRLLTFADWRLLQAERAYQQELETLQTDALQLAEALNGNPNPVAVQMLVERIRRHTDSGSQSLSQARTALEEAALAVGDWSAGVLDRDTALVSLQQALDLLDGNAFESEESQLQGSRK